MSRMCEQSRAGRVSVSVISQGARPPILCSTLHRRIKGATSTINAIIRQPCCIFPVVGSYSAVVSNVFARSLADQLVSRCFFCWRESLDKAVKHATHQLRHCFRSYTTVFIERGRTSSFNNSPRILTTVHVEGPL